MTTQEIVSKLWNLCNVLRDDGITYHQYVTELTYILFLKMAKETGAESQIPEACRWDSLTAKSGIELKKFYKELLNHLGESCTGRVREIYQGAATNIDEPKNLEKIITTIDGLDWFSAREEGLGNLEGSKEIFRVYGDRIKVSYSFDCYLSQCISTAVGSYRYKITAKTAGGHSWKKFGCPNAIQVLCALVEKLYQLKVPEEPKTTYNVGYFNGGTTVNAIAQEASMLFEFRSVSQKCLQDMDLKLREITEDFSGAFSIDMELLGIRPGNGAVDLNELEKFTRQSIKIIKEFYHGELNLEAASTDSNIPLSRGICANTIGTVAGDGAHTREEWIDLDSLPAGMKIALSLMLYYTELAD